MSLAPTSSPTISVRLGAMAIIRFLRYSYSSLRYSDISTTWEVSDVQHSQSLTLLLLSLTHSTLLTHLLTKVDNIQNIFFRDLTAQEKCKLSKSLSSPPSPFHFTPSPSLPLSRTSVPMEISAASLTSSSTSSGSTEERSAAAIPERTPAK